ncbi:hypothetical protein [Nocardia tengchongensis]|uniref:hypothetical protein n=1 Tax=Nocardia tengchongensis TaxID=2055889 RepID=UPI0036B2E363
MSSLLESAWWSTSPVAALLMVLAVLLTAAFIAVQLNWLTVHGGSSAAVATVVAGSMVGTWTANRRQYAREAAARAAVDEAVAAVTDPFDLNALMDINRKQMQEYDAQARGQSATSHWTSLAAMVAGLAIVGSGLAIAVTAHDAAAKYAAAIIAAVGTATGGYIAKTFITMNSSVQDQVRYYFEQPLVASYLITAERFIAQMPETDRSEQYRLLVQAALDQAAAVPNQQTVAPGRSQKATKGPRVSRKRRQQQ